MKDNVMADIEVNLESTDPKELLRSGHHAFLIKDYSNAAAAFGKATQLVAQEHGDEHDSLGEIYLFYGRALLEVSRDEAEPLGDAIPHGDSDSDSSEEDNSAENEQKNDTEKSASENEKTEEKKDDEKSEENGKSEEKTDEKEDKEKDASTNGEAGSSSGVNGEANGELGESTEEPPVDKEEPSDLQLAWEVLEVAKKIFTARGDAGKELLSQTLILLGEVGMESENFSDAVKDIQSGLEIQESLYEKTSRKLAETQYKLGIAHSTLTNIEESIKYFEMSISTLNERIQLLKEKQDDEASKKEIQEIEELIPEIKERINDTRSIKDDAAAQLLMQMAKTSKQLNDSSEGSSSAKEVKDISHLVKRKRKPEDTPDSSDVQPAKKPTP